MNKKTRIFIIPVESYTASHDKHYSPETMEIIDAHNKLAASKLPKRPKEWDTAEWIDYLMSKHASFTKLLNNELSGTPEPENFMQAAEYRDHLRDINKALEEASKL